MENHKSNGVVIWETADKHRELIKPGSTVGHDGETVCVVGVFGADATIDTHAQEGHMTVPIADLYLPILRAVSEPEKPAEEEADDQEMQDGLAAAMVKLGEAVGILQRTPSGNWDEEDDSDNVTNDLISAYQTLGRIITNASIFHGKQTLRAGQSLRRVIDEVGAVANRVEGPVRMGKRDGEQFVENDGANACAARIGLPVVSDSDDMMGITVDIYPEGIRVLTSVGECIFLHYGEFKVPQVGSAIDILTAPAKQPKKTK